ncbi:MAG: helix-turn-helix domain-containing protein [Clostridia bacterium]|nr:helix-turn-helix domain-containing protein [Clostridia bacterium]MBQ8368867.1 helix-turn-helix domain-containing protein [Clostridia bacterium]MBQ8512578.1 helix-turn-helix domain-containing protein [Clostridia bacterium]
MSLSKNFGGIIRQRRRAKDWTQEDMADILNVSPQTVSRWETGDAMPDISLLPVLTNLLEVSADTLLGIDVSRKAVKIREFLDRDDGYRRMPYTTETRNAAIANLREGLRLYPDSQDIKSHLIIWLFQSFEAENLREMNRLCEDLIAVEPDMVKNANTITFLCAAAKTTGNTERALELAKRLPDELRDKNIMISYCLDGEDKDEILRRELYRSFILIESCLHQFACARDANTPADILRYRSIYEHLREVLYENDDLIRHEQNNGYQTARALAKAGDFDNAFRYLAQDFERFVTPFPENPVLSDLREKSCREYYAVSHAMSDAERRDEAAQMIRLAGRDFSDAFKADPRYAAYIGNWQKLAES